jgi:hypothetical protein
MAGGTNDTMAGVKRFDVKPANQAVAMRTAKAGRKTQDRAVV